jgi:hypothetical protein
MVAVDERQVSVEHDHVVGNRALHRRYKRCDGAVAGPLLHWTHRTKGDR